MRMRPRLRGRWGSDNDVNVAEVEKIWTYSHCRRSPQAENGFVQLAEWVVAEANQETVAILVDSGMELAAGKDTS
jgi:hypothetical protein